LFRWAAGSAPLSSSDGPEAPDRKKEEQVVDEERENARKAVRESILWFLRRQLETTIETQRDMVEQRIERAREREKSVLYKSSTSPSGPVSSSGTGAGSGAGVRASRGASISASSSYPHASASMEIDPAPGKASTLDAAEVAAIEAELTPEQLQLFAEENDSMVRYYEDTLSKVQYVVPPPSMGLSIP
jgi:hypothetical protein